LLEEHVLPPLDRRLGERMMRLERRGDDDGVDVVACEHARCVAADQRARMAGRRQTMPFGSGFSDGGEANAGGLGQIAREVRAPVPVPNQTDIDHVKNSAAAAAMY